MKRLITVFMVVALMITLSGCKPQIEDVELHILLPEGAAQMAQAHMQYMNPNIGDHVTYEMVFTDDISLLEDSFEEETHNIIYAPVTMGARYYNENPNYRLAGMVTTGSFSLITGSTETLTLEDLDGKEIYAYEKASTPGIVLEILLSTVDYETDPTITYLNSMSDVILQFNEDNESIILLEEPYTTDLIRSSDYQQLPLQELWNQQLGGIITSIGVFAHKDLDVKVLDSYLRELQLSIIELEDHPKDVMIMLKDANSIETELFWDESVSTSGIVFYEGIDAKQMVVAFFEHVFAYNDEIIGGKYPLKGFYQ